MPKCDKYEPQLLPCNQPVVTNSLHLQSSYTPHLQEHQSEAYLESSQTSAVEAVGYFRGRAPPWMFDRILNATLSNNSLWFEEGLRRSFPPMGLHKRIQDSHCLLILLIYTKNQQSEILDRPCVLISLSSTRKENHELLEQPWRYFTFLSGLSNPTAITQININLQQNKNNHHSLNHLHTLHTH